MFLFVLLRQESLTDAKVTCNSSACIKALGKKSNLSRKPHPKTKGHVDRQTVCEVMAIFVTAILDFFFKFESCTIRSAVSENPT